MPKLLDATDLGGLPTPRIASVQGDGGYGSVADLAAAREKIALQQGNAFANLGQQIAQSAMAVQDSWDKVNDYQVATKFEQFKTNEAKLYDEATRNVQPGEAQGFAAKWDAGYSQRAKDFFATVPDRLKPQYDLALVTYRDNAMMGSGGALDFERGEQRRTALNSLGDVTSNALLPRIEQAAKLPDGDPSKPKQLLAIQEDGFKLIDDNPALTPIEKDEAKRKLKEVLQTGFAKSLSPSERTLIDPATGKQTIAQRIMLVESGGDPTITNPASSAVGAGQFTEGTWLAMVQKYRPDLMKGRSRSDILAMRTDPNLSLEMTQRYSDENASYLGARGYGATAGNLYLAHFLGPQGAVAMLGSDPNATGESIAPAAAKSNPSVFYRTDAKGKVDYSQPKTVGEIRQWASDKMAGAEHTDWSTVLDGIPYEQKLSLAADGARDLLAQQTAQQQQAKAEYTGRIDLLSNMIMDGKAGLTEINQAYDNGNGWLTDPGDREKLTNLYDRVQKDGLALQGATQLVTGAATINPFNDDQKKAVNLYYQKGIPQAGQGLLNGDQGAIQQLRWITSRANMVPDAAAEVLRFGMYSNDPKVRDQAFSILDGLYRENPNAVAQAIKEDGVKRLQDFQALSQLLPPDELAKRMDPFQDPATMKIKDDLRKQGRELAAKIDPSVVLSEFNPGALSNWSTWTSSPDAPIDPVSGQAILDDFHTLYAERFAETGNQEVAQDQALKRLHLKWGTTEIGDGVHIMTYPPERYFPAIDGTHSWMDGQVDDAVETAHPGAQSWAPIVLPQTAGDIGVNRTPTYGIGVIDKDGVYTVILPPNGAKPGWPFDYDKAHGERLKKFEQQRLNESQPVQMGNPMDEPAAMGAGQ